MLFSVLEAGHKISTLTVVERGHMEKWGPAIRILGIGFYIIGCILGGILLGHWLDSKLNTTPILLLVGLVLGLVAAFWGVYQMLIPFIKDNKAGRK